MESLISIIVPVYNVEKYLLICIKSLINQTYKNIEIILVDDGSTDGSSTLCDNIKNIDNRITVYHKVNGGLSDARNFGLKKARGDFVVFVDSDDVVSLHMVDYLYRLVQGKKAIGICAPVHCYSDKDIEYTAEKNKIFFSPEEAIKEMLYQKSFLVSAWGKIYPKDIFDSVEFPVGLLFEDSAIMYLLFEKVDSVIYGDAKLYGYMHHEGSITTQEFGIRDLDILKICAEIKKYMSDREKSMQKAALSYEVVAALRVYLNAPRTNEFDSVIRDTKKMINKEGIYVLLDGKARKKTRMGILLFYMSKTLLFYAHNKIDRWK